MWRRFGISGWVLIFIFLFSAVSFNTQRRHWLDRHVIIWDVQEYYMLLPATFIYHDIDFRFVGNLPPETGKHYWVQPTPAGKNITRRSLGMAILYTPFFLAGHAAAYLTHQPRDGFSIPYQFFILLSGFIYAFIGMVFVRKILLRYFDDLPSALTLACIFLGTNLHYYSTTEAGMSHAPLFMLFAVFLYYTICWHELPKIKFIIAIAVTGALSILVRPTAIIIFLVFFLYGMASRESRKETVARYRQYWRHLILLLFIVFLIGLPQLIYWKMQTGQWLYYTYGKEGFFFSDPKIWKGLFSYRKGWLVYSPVMALSLIGFLWMRKYVPAFPLGIPVFILLHIYIIFSWWNWWYGGSFGMRAMIETYALLALPMAAFWQKVMRYPLLRIIAFFLAAQLVTLNLWQTQLYRAGIIHYDSMSKAFYWAMMREKGYPKEGEKLLDPPDNEAAIRGQR